VRFILSFGVSTMLFRYNPQARSIVFWSVLTLGVLFPVITAFTYEWKSFFEEPSAFVQDVRQFIVLLGYCLLGSSPFLAMALAMKKEWF